MFMRHRLTRLMMWMGLAAAAMYFFDPERGEKRRQELRAKIDSYRKTAERTDLKDLRKTV
jgi:gas vesicle protein